MVLRERERVIFSLALAVVIHGLVIAAIALTGFAPEPYPESTPVFITLPEYAIPQPSASETEPPRPTESPPDAQPQPTANERPVTAGASGPAASAPESLAVQPSVADDAGAPDFSDDPLPFQRESSDRADDRTGDEELFALPREADESQEPPSFMTDEFALQPAQAMPEADQDRFQERQRTDPGFAQRFDALIAALAAAAEEGRSTTGESGPGGDESVRTPGTPSQTTLPGGEDVFWSGAGRGLVSEQFMPDLTAADFGGAVPAQISFEFSFDVDANGNILPGSLIVLKSTGYTAVDQKLRQAISRWRFERAPAASLVTAVSQLTIARDGI